MRLHRIYFISLLAGLLAGGCPPTATDQGNSDLISVVAGITDTGPAASALQSGTAAADKATILTGSISGRDDYRLIDLGAASTGQQWTIADASSVLVGSSFLVVLFDAEFDLLRRQIVSGGAPLEHVLRADTPTLYLGVMPSYGNRGGEFRLEVQPESGLSIPAPRRQVVWLNFDGATDASVHARTGLSFSAFHGASLGSVYAGGTDAIRAAIVAAMRADYAAYNVVIRTSEDGPPPDGAHATLHFGGWDDRLLGLADNVDQYNADPWQTAVIFVESFADFSVMGLSDEEMGQMIGNVASHEFGHLLGLFHTRLPEDVMDTTGTAWDLAGDQSFLRGPLEESVFPVGYENSPQRLTDTVGYNPHAREAPLAKGESTAKMKRKLALRALVRDELRWRCGNCLNPDE